MKPPRKKSYVSLDFGCCSINKNDESGESLCFGYTKNIGKMFLFLLGCLLTGGFLYLVSYWKPNWKLYMTHSRCKLSLASKVLLLDSYKASFVEPVKEYQHNENIVLSTQSIIGIIGNYKYFYHKHLKYVFDEANDKFIAVGGIDNLESFINLHGMSKGLSEDVRQQALRWHGSNLIDIRIKSLALLFAEECTNPFYIFQVFSCILWFLEVYYYFAGVIILITLTSILISIYETRKQLVTLNKMVTTSTTVSILRSDGNIAEISSQNLVPGDVVVLPKYRSTLFCDAALISGTVIVNESMLTGESVPVTKISISRPNQVNAVNNEIFNTAKHSRNTLFCGTEVLQTRYYGDEKVLAVVIRTGFTTMKGELIRSILFPKPVDFKFFSDALKFIGVLFVFALIGCGYAFYAFYINGFGTFLLVLKSLDIFTIAVPPALPAAMSVGTVYALQRLKKQGIFCISPLRINISGRLDLFCFDKTGTLTEDGLDFCGVIRLNDETFSEIENNVANSNDNVTIAMATCHSLTTINNELCGDSLDIKMFQATNWVLEEPGAETERYENIVPLIVKSKNQSVMLSEALEKQDFPLEVAILKQYTFSSELQRMSVVTRQLGSKHMNVYVKGSPEMVASLCNQETIPKTFDECLTLIAKKGYRIIAIAYKELPKQLHWHKVQHFERSQIECELIFLGFIVMKNLLKKETAPVIEKLYNAHIRPVMITGDNILTAESVARECGIVPSFHKVISITLSNDDSQKLIFTTGGLSDELKQDNVNFFLHRQYHLAVTGKAFSVIKEYHPNLYSRLLICGTIFARMLPDQKTSLVEDFQSIGYIVGMCGDGANDCGALKRAHTGISLSEAEASVASPFTSKVQNISCVLQVIKEGRCALVTSFNLFKFMALYSMIQYSSVLLLYSISSNLGDFQFLYIDLFIITSFAVTMGRTGPTDFLSPKPPLDRLMHPNVLFSIVMQIITQTGFQVLFFFYAKTLPNYLLGYRRSGKLIIESFENTILFTSTSFQYILIALVFSPGFPYRKPFYHNKGLVACIITFVVMNCFLLIKPCKFFMKVLEIKQVQDVAYFEVVLGLLLCNLLVSYIIDFLIVDSHCMRSFLNIFNRKKRDKQTYKQLIPQFISEPSLNQCNDLCNSVST